jgi:hypothetical protein
MRLRVARKLQKAGALPGGYAWLLGDHRRMGSMLRAEARLYRQAALQRRLFYRQHPIARVLGNLEVWMDGQLREVLTGVRFTGMTAAPLDPSRESTVTVHVEGFRVKL